MGGTPQPAVSVRPEPQRRPRGSHHPSHRVFPGAPGGLPPLVPSVSSSGRAGACPRSIMRMRTCSWTRALRSRWASAASRPRSSSCRSEGKAREQTPASGCRADSRKALVSCMVPRGRGQPGRPAQVSGGSGGVPAFPSRREAPSRPVRPAPPPRLAAKRRGPHRGHCHH